jgi:hypothetical protein
VIPSGSGLIRGEGAVFARLHTIDTTKEQYEVGFEIIQNQFLPWARPVRRLHDQ